MTISKLPKYNSYLCNTAHLPVLAGQEVVTGGMTFITQGPNWRKKKKAQKKHLGLKFDVHNQMLRDLCIWKLTMILHEFCAIAYHTEDWNVLHYVNIRDILYCNFLNVKLVTCITRYWVFFSSLVTDTHSFDKTPEKYFQLSIFSKNWI